MSPHEITALAERALRLYALNRDPLTFSAAAILAKVKSSRLTEPQRNAVTLINKQLAAYEALYTDPLP